MASVIEIVNRALTKLGDANLTSLEDDCKTAQLASAMYDLVRDGEISAHSWNFAKARAVLPADLDKPVFGWEWQYSLPADCLRILEAGPWPQAVMADYVGGDSRPFIEEGGKLLTNLPPALNLVYLRRITDSGYYPPVFTDALACKLAVELCEPVTGSNSKRQMAWQEYERTIKQARRLNAIGRPPLAPAEGSWVTARLSGQM